MKNNETIGVYFGSLQTLLALFNTVCHQGQIRLTVLLSCNSSDNNITTWDAAAVCCYFKVTLFRDGMMSTIWQFDLCFLSYD